MVPWEKPKNLKSCEGSKSGGGVNAIEQGESVSRSRQQMVTELKEKI